MFIIFSTLCILASRVLSQNINFNPNPYQNIFYPDQIYYPRSHLSVLPIARTYNRTERVNYADPQQQSRYWSQYSPNRNPGLSPTQPPDFNANVRTRMQQPSINLQTPTYNDKKQDNNVHNRFGDTNNEEDFMEVTPPPPAIKVGPLSRSITNFGMNLVKTLQQRGRNLVLSPFSIASLLALLQQGSVGITQKQITAALQISPEVASASYKNLTDDIRKRSGSNILNAATNIYIADTFQVNPAFKSVAINNFNSEVTPAKFSSPVRTAQMINNWVATKTNNKIENLLTADAIGENSQAVLVNAVYFKGTWAIRFNPDITFKGSFSLNGARQTVSYMQTKKHFRTGVDRTNIAEIIVLPFEHEQYSLMIVLPSEVSSIADVLPTLTDAKLLEYHQFPYQETHLELPKFTVRADTDLNSALRQLGIVNMFGSSSELSGVGSYNQLSPQISSAVHSAVLTVDEDGGSAAAATAFAVVALSYGEPSVIFKVKRPFIAVLWDSSSGVPLFMATIENPGS